MFSSSSPLSQQQYDIFYMPLYFYLGRELSLGANKFPDSMSYGLRSHCLSGPLRQQGARTAEPLRSMG